MDEDDNSISESLEQSPRSETDETSMIVRSTCDDYAESETQGQSTFIILDSGSEVSLLPRDCVTGDSTVGGHKLQDCQGNALGVAGTKREEILLKDVEDVEKILRQELFI